MTQDEANEQVAAFLRRLGHPSPPALPFRARIGEAFLEFEYGDAEQALSMLALIYRFRAEPRPGVVAALLDAATPANTGGGRLVIENGRAVVLRRDVVDRTPDQHFAEQVDALGRASLVWSGDLFGRAVETVDRHRA